LSSDLLLATLARRLLTSQYELAHIDLARLDRRYRELVLESVARVATAQPERYLKQLVSHLGHRRSTELHADGSGLVRFDDGRCELTAQPGVLVLTASAEDLAGLTHVQDVIKRHLERFGTRAELQVTWSPPA
jgi:caffeoyl-CoA O-methyltransferase